MTKLKHSLFVALLAISAISCEDILTDVKPATSLTGDAVLSTAAGVEALRASMYSKIRANFGYTTLYLLGPSALADETRNRPGQSRFDDLNTNSSTDGRTSSLTEWGGTYSIILDANLLINNIPDGVLAAGLKERYRGEALAIRAFAMHHLARTISYEPTQTAARGFDLSIVIRTTPTVIAADADNRPRSTVAEVYTQIRADIAEAKTLLAGVTATNTNNVYANLNFVQALEARVELYAGNWSAASTAAQAAITGSGRSLANTATAVANMFSRATSVETIFRITPNANTEQIGGSNVNNGPAAYTSDQWVAQIPTQKVLGLYAAGDHRLAGWYIPCFNRAGNAAAPGCGTVNTAGVALAKYYGRNTNLSDDLHYMRLGELYLIWAEAAAKAANDPNAGVAPLTTLRTARNAGAVPAGALASMADFENFILEERMRELVGEGHRFYDLKRLGRDIVNVDNSVKIRADSYRMLGYIPAGVISLPGSLITQNPGY
jgi:hypothetical protein